MNPSFLRRCLSSPDDLLLSTSVARFSAGSRTESSGRPGRFRFGWFPL